MSPASSSAGSDSGRYDHDPLLDEERNPQAFREKAWQQQDTQLYSSRTTSTFQSTRRSLATAVFNPVVLSVLLLASLTVNIYFLAVTNQTLNELVLKNRRASVISPLSEESPVYKSEYAQVPLDVHRLVEEPSDYASPNMTLAAPLWDAINFDRGMVALDYAWTDAVGLPRAQKFPWDHEKGLYVLNGYHNLHCVKAIHLSIQEFVGRKRQTRPLAHITHCLDSLRQDVLCNADDTPRYTTITRDPKTAVGQFRQCKNWSKLEEFAKKNSACYRYLGAEADNIDQFERFKYCPTGSPYWKQVREHWDKPDGWFPKPMELAGGEAAHHPMGLSTAPIAHED